MKMVQVWTGEVGAEQYRTADGWVGVALLNEQGRVDEWQEWQVTPISPEQAGRLAAERMAR